MKSGGVAVSFPRWRGGQRRGIGEVFRIVVLPTVDILAPNTRRSPKRLAQYSQIREYHASRHEVLEGGPEGGLAPRRPRAFYRPRTGRSVSEIPCSQKVFRLSWEQPGIWDHWRSTVIFVGATRATTKPGMVGAYFPVANARPEEGHRPRAHDVVSTRTRRHLAQDLFRLCQRPIILSKLQATVRSTGRFVRFATV